MILSFMKYFESYFTDPSAGDNIDISVQCDITTFEWLLAFVNYEFNKQLFGEYSSSKYQMHYKVTQEPLKVGFAHPSLSDALAIQPPSLTIKNCLSILLSANYLQIQLLTDLCI